jgi:molybdopterin molybdotransferase
MIEVEEAVKIVNQSQIALEAMKIPFEDALGRVLRQDIVADTDFPPFDRVMMDGIAVQWSDYDEGQRIFDIVGIQAAGSPQIALERKYACLEVMTGAIAPAGTNLVVPYEDVEIDESCKKATILADDLVIGKNIHSQATDKQAGSVLVPKGTYLGVPEMAMAASVGMSELQVARQPSIAIVSTGNELVDISDKPQKHQVRKSNVYALAMELKLLGLTSDLYHLDDERALMEHEMSSILDHHEVVLMSGGVSRGKFDFVPDVLESLGVQKLFHRIRQKPGKPMLFGTGRGKNVVFAFPGNPVSTFMCFHKYFVPWLKGSLGVQPPPSIKAVLNQDFSIKTNLSYFLQVWAWIDARGVCRAAPMVGRGSGDHANLLHSNAFLELPPDTQHFQKGQVFPLIPFRAL